MNDLIKLIFAQIPKYITNFVNLISRPKRFVRERNQIDDESLTEALTFLGITFVLSLIITSPLRSEGVNLWQHVAARGLLIVIAVTVNAAVLRLSWRLVGGKADFLKFFIPFCYFYAIGNVFLDVTHLLALGVAKFWDPEFYQLIVEHFRKKSFLQSSEAEAFATRILADAQSGNFTKALVFITFVIISQSGWVAFFLWMVAGWGTFREVTGLSKERSLAAGVIFLVLAVLVFFFSFYAYVALTEW